MKRWKPQIQFANTGITWRMQQKSSSIFLCSWQLPHFKGTYRHKRKGAATDQAVMTSGKARLTNASFCYHAQTDVDSKQTWVVQFRELNPKR